MNWRLCFLLALLLPELPMDPTVGSGPPAWPHLLGQDEWGRDGLLRLALAGSKSLGFASAAGLGALVLGTGMVLISKPWRAWIQAWRILPPLLWLLPIAAYLGGMDRPGLGLILALLLALQFEPVLEVRLEPFMNGPALAMERVLGATLFQTTRRWAPWWSFQMKAVFPGAWIAALWGEATLSILGLGPGPTSDSLGRILLEELPLLAIAPSPMAWTSLLLLLGLSWISVEPDPRS